MQYTEEELEVMYHAAIVLRNKAGHDELADQLERLADRLQRALCDNRDSQMDIC